MKRYEITSKEWGRTKDLFPYEKAGKRGRPSKSNRDMLNGMLWIPHCCRWTGESSVFSAGNVNASEIAVNLLSLVNISQSNVLADKANGTNEILDYIQH